MYTFFENVIIVLVYLFIGYKLGIIRYRFAHSDIARTKDWNNHWKSFLFYPATRNADYETQESNFETSYYISISGAEKFFFSVLKVEPSTYVISMMFFWLLPTVITVAYWIIFLLYKIYCKTHISLSKCVAYTIKNLIKEGCIFLIRLAKGAINKTLPEDMKDSRCSLVVKK